MSAPTNYFELGPLIIERLSELAPRVDQIASLDMLDATHLPAKGIYVSMSSEDIGDITGDGMATQMFQTWAITPIVFNAHELPTSMGPQQEMGELILKIHNLIAGWRPTEDYGYFMRQTGAGPQYQESHWIYPMGFQIQVPLFADG